jgi:RNA-directed DNA polymerase
LASASSNWHIITGQSKRLLKEQAKPAVAALLAKRGLTLSEEKTAITPIKPV